MFCNWRSDDPATNPVAMIDKQCTVNSNILEKLLAQKHLRTAKLPARAEKQHIADSNVKQIDGKLRN